MGGWVQWWFHSWLHLLPKTFTQTCDSILKAATDCDYYGVGGGWTRSCTYCSLTTGTTEEPAITSVSKYQKSLKYQQEKWWDLSPLTRWQHQGSSLAFVFTNLIGRQPGNQSVLMLTAPWKRFEREQIEHASTFFITKLVLVCSSVVFW